MAVWGLYGAISQATAIALVRLRSPSLKYHLHSHRIVNAQVGNRHAQTYYTQYRRQIFSKTGASPMSSQHPTNAPLESNVSSALSTSKTAPSGTNLSAQILTSTGIIILHHVCYPRHLKLQERNLH
ncbi:hypothetical protein C8Q75DRAFT_812099 [Abortiporus biennis]|nr:hypothetical protein C8Q75DRAFT_812099 [Abortiporus biennis]